ncbi:hypothetical protein [Sphingobium sp. GW456-12-10-14-TSB1]|uniref:hypothetical protein n=1 Tax=Sphingobium sp. GW456-12-10-14-TSB1 TaxID=1987165 RepID=UPI0020CE540C|nr:hypothetical protein [Sphingobium sp. GW456-12-10-14-TSB1]
MIEDHLRFARSASLGGFPEIQQPPRIEQRICVAFETAGIPCKVDKQPIQYLLRVGSCRCGLNLRLADCSQMIALLLGQIEGFVGPVTIQEGAVIADRLSHRDGLAHIGKDSSAFR